jgi:N-acetylmuramoyl-L-alanine amidase
MRRISSARTQRKTEWAPIAILLATALAMSLAPLAAADTRDDARFQFERAVKMRTTLEGYLERDRALDDYKRTVSAYHRVYLITPDTEQAAPALIAEGELYQEMGRLFDPRYFQSAIDRYDFLLKQYPTSRYRSGALFSIGEIQSDELNKSADAEASFEEFLRRFPRSDRAGDARRALKEVSVRRQTVRIPGPDLRRQAVEPRVSDRRTPSVEDVHAWTAQDSTRIVVTLEDTIRYDAIRIPDRIYFDLYKARINPKLAGKTLDVNNGLLKSVRVAQNKPDVVRLVLDVNGARDYSAFLLSNPFRLVIDVYAGPAATTTKLEPLPARANDTAPVNNEGAKSAGGFPVAPSESASVSSDDRTAEPAPSPLRIAAKTTVSQSQLEPLPMPKRSSNGPVSLVPETPSESKPTRDGQRSLTRALGLKISRIVIDPGHGGHDTGTIGPRGLMEKDLCLDVALRLGHLIEQKLPGAAVIYTRKDDSFIPLEDRTKIANEAKADLFISIHANSSHDPAARGVETYYLNFATSEESMEVASRENALAQESLHDLQDIIKKIARNEKLEESKEFASDIQDSLAQRLQLVSHSEKNRGVKKAPFVVLIGADMPSVLSEISFVSNPNDEKLLRKIDQRQRIADGLYRGIASYLDNLNSLSYNRQKLVSDNHVEAGTVASGGNPK